MRRGERMKTLEEYIAYCEEVADRKPYFDNEIGNMIYPEGAIITLEEHRQLAEWLKELKAYKEAYVEIKNKTESGYFGFDDYEEAEANGYRKAIKIIDKCIEEVKADG